MRTTHRHARALANGLDIPDPWDVAALCEIIAATVGLPIVLLARPAARDSITASVMRTKTAYVIFYRDDLTGNHRDHAIAHELGHILAGHLDGDLEVDDDVTGAAALMLNRDCNYGDEREGLAERLADLIIARVPQQAATTSNRAVQGFNSARR